ncbi:MAG: hypothetical protein HKN00_01790 [Flavobacteriaceae bacterium]|nr:hypothetical protein [Flavobacteriaceae bacterium]NNK74246.1 hypothetical protein [Flavobacteriaceae bacterium]
MDKFVPKKVKPLLLLGLWVLIAFLAYKTFMSVYGEIQFNKIKQERYSIVIDNLIDIRDSQLAHRTVTGKFAGSWDNLVRFIDTAQFTITQRRDTSVLDVEATRRFGGVETYKDIVMIDTLAFVSVKDSLFGADDRYKTMMNLPVGKEGAKFELKSGMIDQTGLTLPVFEVRAPKALILDDQDKYLVAKENQVVSVDGVNGDAIIVGSMDEVNTNGNWPKNYSTKE